MVLEDFPIVLAQHGLPTDKLAVMGISMGGYGALLAASEAPKRFLAAVASSPAFWDSFDEATGRQPDRLRLRGRLAHLGRPAHARRRS